jgi:predicted nucleotidyltransferase
MAFVYGSFAKGEQNSFSDIDLLAVGTFNEDIFLREIERLEKSLNREINYKIYRRSEFEKLVKAKDPFLLGIIKETKIMLKGAENDF